MSSRRIVILASLILLLLVTGFLRSFLIENTNLQLVNELYQTDEYKVAPALSFLYSFDYWTTYGFKCLIILFFSILYWLETHWILKVLFNEDYLRLVSYCFGFLLAVTFITYGGFALFGEFQKGYEIARYPLTWIQSPIPLMFLIPGLFLRRDSSRES